MNLLVSNPAAGNAKETGDWLSALARAGVKAKLAETENGQFRSALTGDDCLIVAGGDGTIRSYAAVCLDSSCTLGILPAGTGNDFARGLNIPLDPDSACENISSGLVAPIDVGLLDDDIYLNVAHIGLGTEISRNLEGEHKHWWGRFAYLRTFLQRFRQARGFHATIECADEVIKGRWLQITVANGRSFGGGQRFFDASPFDGQLDLLAVRPRPLFRLFLVWVLAHVKGSTPDNEAIVQRRGKTFRIVGDSQRQVTADGEVLAHLPVRFTVMESALRVLVPESTAELAPGRGGDPPQHREVQVGLIRSDEQAKLGELYALGSGMLLRYRELLAAGAGELQPLLERVLAQRGELIDRLAEAEQARSQVQSAPDQEINELRALGDRFLKALLGEDPLKNRLLKAEQEWIAELEQAQPLAWADTERELLAALAAESGISIAELRALLGETD